MTADLLAAQALARSERTCPVVPADKWQILRDLTVARTAFGLSDRDLTVLAALVSFHRETQIKAETTIVFPSNATLSQRAHGMAESTLRRHLASLVKAGFILRHDSPNGKRYAVRGFGARIDRAFGFDLSPLARRAPEIGAIAEAMTIATEELRQLREGVVLRLRDCDKLAAYAATTLPGNWDALTDAVALAKRALRRKLDKDALGALDLQARDLLQRLNMALVDCQPPKETPEMSGSAGESGRHKQDSTKNTYESKKAHETVKPQKAGSDDQPELPLHLVLQGCPEILSYAPDGIANWHDLIVAAAFVRGMIGIDHKTWDDAQTRMTPAIAAIAVACILQSYERITNPGGYLRTLARKASDRVFSPGPMVMALLQTQNMRAA